MAAQLVCPTCRTAFHLPDGASGRPARCERCGYQFTMPESAAWGVASDTVDPTDGGVTPSYDAGRLGRFELRQRLGAGGFGAVYRAYDPTLDREVALKVPHVGPIAKGSSDGPSRFLREARAAAKLRHPHIVPVFEAEMAGDRPYIASALIAGRSLQEAVSKGPIDPARAARIAAELGEALGYAHAQGVVHRDVKPANVMLDEADRAQLTDFGLARHVDDPSLTPDGAIFGTPGYMPPEQARGEAADAASDQYALGATLYQMLCGQPPFSGPIASVLYNVVHTPPTPPREHNADVPPALEAICLRALAKHPNQRYAGCLALAGDLRRWLDHGESPTLEPRRHRPALILISLALLVVAAGIGLWSLRNRKPATPETPTPPVVRPAEPDRAASKAPPAPEKTTRWALSFNGKEDYVETKLHHTRQPMTLEALVRPEPGPWPVQTLFGNSEGKDSVGLGLVVLPQGRWLFSVHSPRRTATVRTDDAPAIRGAIHVAGVYDPAHDRIGLFLDGRLAGGWKTFEGGANRRGQGPILIGLGRGPNGLLNYLSGAVSWARVSGDARYQRPFIPPVSCPPSDADTLLLLDFSAGERGPVRKLIDDGTIELHGTRWVEQP